MKYLKKVILKNFQSHKNSIIEFNEGLNVIVGPSDSGKSAIIRGIKWALYNDPLGDYFIREGETEASVTLEFSNNIKVKRLRSKSRNAYMLYNIEGEEMVFEGFGSTVPKEIVEVLSIKKIPLDSNETNAINLGEQLEGAFLLSEKGSVRASAIGRLVGVDLIDDALRDTLKDVRNISINKKIMTENIENIEKELTKYSYLDKLKEDIKKLDDLRSILDKKIKLKDRLIKMIKDYKSITEEKEYFNNILHKTKNIENLEINIYKIENKSGVLKTYKNIDIKLNKNNNQIAYNKNILNNFENIDIAENIINIINTSQDKLQKLSRLKTTIYKNRMEIEKLSLINKNLRYVNIIQEKTKSIESKTNEFNKLNSFKKRSYSINKSLEIGKNYIRNFKDLDEIEKCFNNLDNLIITKYKISKLFISLNNIKKESKKEKDILIKTKKLIDSNLTAYEKIFIESEVCPFCLSQIDENKIDHIVKHYK